MPSANALTSNYRYGFNGKENDREWGTSLIQDYGFRLYNPALAKFLSVDPLAPEYPWYTPYQYSGNMPIKFIDRDGLEPEGNLLDWDWRQSLIELLVFGPGGAPHSTPAKSTDELELKRQVYDYGHEVIRNGQRFAYDPGMFIAEKCNGCNQLSPAQKKILAGSVNIAVGIGATFSAAATAEGHPGLAAAGMIYGLTQTTIGFVQVIDGIKGSEMISANVNGFFALVGEQKTKQTGDPFYANAGSAIGRNFRISFFA